MGLQARVDDERVGREAKMAKSAQAGRAAAEEQAAIREYALREREQAKIEAMRSQQNDIAKRAYLQGISTSARQEAMQMEADLLAEQELMQRASAIQGGVQAPTGSPTEEELIRQAMIAQAQGQPQGQPQNPQPTQEELMMMQQQQQQQQVDPRMMQQQQVDPRMQQQQQMAQAAQQQQQQQQMAPRQQVPPGASRPVPQEEQQNQITQYAMNLLNEE